MSKLEELLQGVDVEWKRLDTIYKFQYGKGNTIPKKGGLYPVYGSNGIVGTHSEYNSEDSPVIGHIGAYAGIVNWGSGKHFVTYNGIICKLIDESVNPKFAYYFLLNQNFNSIAKSASHPFISYEALNKVLCPIPCPDNPEKSLEIQQEIVRVLDELTALTNQLTTELESERQNRKKQFEFFREQLFTFEEGEAELKNLKDVAIKISSGGTPNTKKIEYWENGTIPWMSSGEVNFGTIYKTEKYITEEGLKNSSAKFIPKNSIVIALAGQGKTRGMVARTKIELTTNQSLGTLSLDNNIVNTDYVYYYLKTQYENLRTISSGNENRGGLNLKMISSYPIPIPPLEEQERIVKFLDQFDATHTAIEEEITKEIKLRTQQYEYYREKLLSFPQN